MEEDLLTFERLRDIRKEEQNSDTLTDLEEGFYQDVEEYLERKRRIGADKSSDEYKNALHMVEDIVDTRSKKIMKIAFLSTKTKIPTKKLLKEEKKLFKDVKKAIEEHQENIENIQKSEEIEEKQEEETESKGGNKTVKEEGDNSEKEEGKPEEDEVKEPERSEETSEKDDMNEDDEDEDNSSGEELLFDASQESKKESKNSKKKKEPEKQVSEEKKEKKDSEKYITIINELKEFTGPDMEIYGPFEKGEKVRIKKDVADLLVKQGNAKNIPDSDTS